MDTGCPSVGQCCQQHLRDRSSQTLQPAAGEHLLAADGVTGLVFKLIPLMISTGVITSRAPTENIDGISVSVTVTSCYNAFFLFWTPKYP